MEIKEILKHVDHTLLLQPSTWEEIRQICDDAMKYGTASVCIPPCYVKQAAEYMDGKMAVCTVTGFPNGNMTTATKEFETKDALANGASEIDMVINIGWLKDKKYDLIENEVRTLKAACGDKILKVIIETCLLTDAEKVKVSELCVRAGAQFVKTSTGFSKGGATREDVALIRKAVGPAMGIKASGGVRNMDDALQMIAAGATRIGTSGGIGIIKGDTATKCINCGRCKEACPTGNVTIVPNAY